MLAVAIFLREEHARWTRRLIVAIVIYWMLTVVLTLASVVAFSNCRPTRNWRINNGKSALTSQLVE